MSVHGSFAPLPQLPLTTAIRSAGVALLILLLVMSRPAAGVMITGTVEDAGSGARVSQASVLLADTEQLVKSDERGVFEIDVDEPGYYRLRVTHVAYEPYQKDLYLSGKDVRMVIRLTTRIYINDGIVVTGTRTPYLLKDVPVTTEVIRREAALATGAKTVDEALEAAVGINVDNNLSGTGVSLRGLDPTRVLVLIDSERVVGRVRGSIDLSQISLDNVEKIEVVKGVGSTLYGSDAIGGVVNIITRKPRHSPRIASFFEYSTYNTVSQLLEFETGVGGWAVQAGGKADRTDGFDLIAETPHTNGLEKTRRYSFDARVLKRLSRTLDLKANYAYLNERKDWLESELIEQLTYSYDDRESNYRHSGSTKLLFMPSPKTVLDINFYATYYDHLFEKRYQGRLTDRSRTEDWLAEASAVATHSYGDGHVVTAGGDLAEQSLASEEVVGGKQTITSGDLYLQYEWKPWAKLVMVPGIRLEEHETFGTHLNASLNVMYNPFDRLRLRGFHGGGFRAPSIKELYFIFDHSAAGYKVEGGGSALKPETSKNSAVTVEYGYSGIGLHRLTYFYNQLDNLIEFDLLGFSETYWRGEYRYMNVFRAYTRGIEWESQVAIKPSLSFSFSYTWLTAKNSENGHWLLNRPEHTVKFRCSYRQESVGILLTLWGNWYSGKLWTPLGEQNDFDSNIWAPSRREINLSLTKDLGDRIQLVAKAENITDDVDVEFGYWPGRTFHVGANFQLHR